MKTASASAVACLILGACGQKGPLYLPDEAGEVVTRPAPTAEPAPEEDDDSADPPR